MLYVTYWNWKTHKTQETQIALTKVPAYGPLVSSIFHN